MSNTVDERVVKMQFDNAQFEQNVQTSISTLDRLKQALTFDKTSKPLEGINDAIKKNNISSLGDAVDAVSSKFSALEIVGITAIANITNSIVNKLKVALNDLTLKPITEGFQEYELKMGSVQTIMMSTGEKLSTVNKYLEELNTYSDKTIYSFRDMTSNIGKFTNAGVKLDDAVAAIQGVSNVAAISGANANEASRAMYNFSQALSSGSVKLIDWKSIENANMATVDFKQTLLDTAVALGTVKKTEDGYVTTTANMQGKVSQAFDATKGFNDSLAHQWMTTDVLTATLRAYSTDIREMTDAEKDSYEAQLKEQGYTEEQIKRLEELGIKAFDAAQEIKTFSMLLDTLKEAVGSGWAQTWEILFGDFNEAKKLWTEVGDVIGGFINDQAEARNNLLKTWKKLGGRTALLDGLHNTFSALLNVIHPVQEAFSDVFKPLVAFDLFTITKKFRDFTAGLHLTDEAAQKVYDVFHGLFSIIHGVGNVFGTLSKLVGPLIEVFKVFFSIFLDIVSELGQGLTFFSDTASQSSILATAVEFLSNVLLKFADIVRNAWDIIKEFYSSIKESFVTPGLNGLLEIINAISDGVTSLKNSAVDSINDVRSEFGKSTLLENLKNIFNAIKNFITTIGTSIGNFVTQIASAFGPGTVSIFDKLLNVLTAGGIALAIKNLLKLKDVFSIGKTLKGFSGALETVKDTVKSFQTEVKAKALMKIAIAVGILAVSLLILSSIDPQKMQTGLEGMTAALAELVGALAIIDKLKTDPKKMITNGTGMILIAFAVTILAGAIKKLSDLDLSQIGKGLLAIGVLLKMISQFLNGTYFDNKGAIGSAISILIVASAIRVLASSVAYLGNLDLATIGKGLLAIGALLFELSIFTKIASGAKGMLSTGLSLIFIAASMKIFASAMKDFAAMEWEEIKKGLVAMGGALLELSIALRLIPKGSAGKGLALILVAKSMVIVAGVFEQLGSMNWEKIGKSLVAMGGALLELDIALNLVPKGAASKSISLVIAAASLLIVAKAFEQFGSMNWDQIGKSLAAMGGALLEITVALSLMQGGLGGAAALLIVAAALAIITPILIALCNLEWDQIGKGLLALAGAFIVFGLAGALLGPFALGLAALGAAIAVVAGGFFLFGAALGIVAAGILALARTISAVPAAVEAIVAILDGLIQQVIPLLGALIEKILETFVSLLPTITVTVINVVSNVLAILIAVAPMILQAVLTLLTNLLQMIAENIPAILSAVVGIITAVLDGIRNAIPMILYQITGIILAVLVCIRNVIPQIVTVVGEIIVAFINAVTTQIPAIINTAFNLIISFVDGLASAIDGNTDRLVSAVQHLISAIINAAVKLLSGSAGTFLSKGGELIGKLASGIVKNAQKVLSGVGSVLSKAIKYIVSNLPEWLSKGAELIGKLASGIAKKAPDVVSKVKDLLSKAKSAITQKYGEFVSAGKNMISGLISGVAAKAGELADKARSVVSGAISAAKNALQINSPSKVFRSMGYSIDEGLIVGMTKMADKVSEASEFVTTGIIDAAKGPLDYLADLLSGDIIDDPTITPVLDLSEIQNGANRLYSMLPDSERLSLNGNVDLASMTSRSVDLDRRRKAESDNQMMGRLIDAIDGLSALIGNTGNTYNVNGVTYDDGSNISSAVRTLVRAAVVEGRA